MVAVQGRQVVGRSQIIGVIGAILIAIGSHLAGALPYRNIDTPSLSVATVTTMPWYSAGVVAWAVGTAMLVVAWWRVGRLARTGGLSLRAVVVTAVMWAVPFLLAAPLASRDIYSYAAQGDLFAHGVNPYEHGPSALPSQWLEAVAPTWRDTAAPYGPLFLLAARAAATVSGGNLIAAIILLRLVAVAGVVLTASTLPLLARQGGVAPGTAMWLGLASPLALVHLIGGAHNDALMIGLVVAGLAAATRRRAVVSGAAIGLAVAVKATAVVVAPFAVLLTMPALVGRWRMVRASLLVGAGMVAAYGAITLASGLGFGWAAALGSSGKSTQWTSPSTGVGLAIGYVGALLGHPEVERIAVLTTRIVGTALLAVVLVVMWWQVRRTTDTTTLVVRAGWALAAVVVLGPVFHAWYALLPLTVLGAVVADDRVRRGLAVIAAALSFLVLPNGYSLALSTKLPGAIAQVVLVTTVVVWWIRRRRRADAPTPQGPAGTSPQPEADAATSFSEPHRA